jgi:IS30 family transposase
MDFPDAPKKNEALSLMKDFWELASTQSGHQIKAIRVDNGTEYGNIQGCCQEKGMKLEFSTTYTAHQNGVSERSNSLSVPKHGPCSMLLACLDDFGVRQSK